ncbi:MAG: glycosyltransferase [Rhodanobacteraceae bacterium]
MEKGSRDAAGQGLRILVLTDTPILGPGGSERFLRNLLGRLPAQCRVDVLQLTSEPDSASIVGNLDLSHVRLSYHPIRAIYGPAGLKAIARIRKLVRDGNYDIVQSHHEKSDLINALLPRHPNRMRRLSNRRDMGFQKSARMRWLMRRLNHRFDRIVAPSTAILDSLAARERVDRAKLICIPNGVDTQRFVPLPEAKRTVARAELGFADDDLLVGCVANLYPVKRHSDLVEAFARVYSALPTARLLLVGDGPLRSTLERQITRHGLGDAARLLGDRDDIASLLPIMDVFILASSSEGLSNAILEAQACALPVIATRVGGNPDLVDENCGRLVAPAQPAALAAAMLGLLRDPALRSRLGAAARARVEPKHSLQGMVDSYLRLYQDMAGDR